MQMAIAMGIMIARIMFPLIFVSVILLLFLNIAVVSADDVNLTDIEMSDDNAEEISSDLNQISISDVGNQINQTANETEIVKSTPCCHSSFARAG